MDFISSLIINESGSMNHLNSILGNNHKLYLLISVFISIVCALFSQYLLILLLVSIFLIISFFFKEHFLVLISLLVFLILTGSEVEQFRSYFNFILTLFLAIIFFRKYGLNIKGYPQIPNQLIYFVFFLIITLLIASLFSHDTVSALTSVLRQIIFLVICYFYYSLIQTEKTIEKYIQAVFISVLIVGISILIDVYKSGFALFLLERIVIRYGGIYENPNYVGLLLLITIPINIALFFKSYSHSSLVKTILALVLVLSILLLFISDSRSSIFGTAIASGITIFLINKKLFFKAVGIFSILIILSVTSSDIQNILTMYLRLERIGNREYFWNAGIDVIKDYPYFGIGPELFDKYFFSYMPSLVNQLYESSSWEVGRPHPHNFFLLWTAENGIFGFICSILIFVLFFYFTIKTFSFVKKSEKKSIPFVAASIGIGAGLFFRAFFEVTGVMTYGFITRDLPFWIVFMSIIFIYQKGTSEIKLLKNK